MRVEMEPTRFRTYVVDFVGDALGPLISCEIDKPPVQAVVRAGLVGIAFSQTLEGLAVPNAFKVGGFVTESYVLPPTLGDAFSLAPGQQLYAGSLLGRAPVSVARIEAPFMRYRSPSGRGGRARTMPIFPTSEPQLVAYASDRGPTRVYIRNFGGNFLTDILCLCEEFETLRRDPLQGYQLRTNPTFTARDAFVLAPGQVLYAALAPGSNPMTISVMSYDGLDENWILETM